MPLFEFVIRICCAVVFGFLIGLERQITGHVAGIRTNILVSMGACLFTLFSQLMGAPDNTRIAAQVVTGIGFLCGGVIFKTYEQTEQYPVAFDQSAKRGRNWR